MAKKWAFAMVAAAAGLLLPPSALPTPFEMRVVDEQTGMGVPVRVTTDNGIDRDTPNGFIYWWSPTLMSRSVRFEVQDERNQFDSAIATVRVTHGGRATVRLHRRS
jgi:hypothetical protein